MQDATDKLDSLEEMMEAAWGWVLVNTPHMVRILFFLVGAWIVSRVTGRLIGRLELLAEDDDPTTLSEREKRARTLGRILRQAAGVMIWGVTAALILAELGVDLKPILAGAGIAGLAIGFGAQTLVKDIIAGFFVLLENQYRVNDVIQAAGVAGLVESINLRTTVLRDIEGRVHIIPNGEVGVVTNFTREWSRALLDVGVAYKEDTDRCFDILRQVAKGMKDDPEWGRRLVDEFEFPGVDAFGDSAVVLRVMVKTVPQERWNVLRELRRRVKKAFDREGIEIPYPHLTLYVGGDASQQGRLAVKLPEPAQRAT